MLRLLINEADFGEVSPQALAKALDESAALQFREIWLTGRSKSLCALVDGDSGWLMYLAKDEDVSLHSHNPDYTGPNAAQREYRLSNGQVDAYPESWVLPWPEVRAALLHFAREAGRSPNVVWEDDAAGLGDKE